LARYEIQNIVQALVDIVVLKAQHTPTTSSQISLARFIVYALFVARMGCTINFNGQVSRDDGEVRDIDANGCCRRNLMAGCGQRRSRDHN